MNNISSGNLSISYVEFEHYKSKSTGEDFLNVYKLGTCITSISLNLYRLKFIHEIEPIKYYEVEKL